MSDNTGDRSRFFPAIEKKYGESISTWITRVRDLGEAKYADQMALLQDRFGFSRTHANVIVMFVRGSASSKRYPSTDSYFDSIDAEAAATARKMFASIQKSFPGLDLVVAWNQPVLRTKAGYVFGLSVARKHLTINPFSKEVIDEFAEELSDLGVSKHTFKVPFDWKVNAGLLHRIVKARLAELG